MTHLIKLNIAKYCFAVWKRTILTQVRMSRINFSMLTSDARVGYVRLIYVITTNEPIQSIRNVNLKLNTLMMLSPVSHTLRYKSSTTNEGI